MRRLMFGMATVLVLSSFSPRAAEAQVVSSWESAIANLDVPSGSGQTIRQFARISVGGPQIRVRFSNETGTQALAVADTHVALPGSTAGSIDPGSDHPVTFGGSSTVTLPPGADIISDPVDLSVAALTRLAVSAYFSSGSRNQVGHLVASETNYLALGDHAGDATMAGAVSVTSGYYLAGLSAEVGTLPSGVVACLGDSITDGFDSTPDTEHRYPDRLAERLLAVSGGRVGAIDAGIAGNALLSGTLIGIDGASGLTRLRHDVFRPGVHWLIVFEGINDIVSPPGGDTTAELIASYLQIIAQAHEFNMKVFGATLTPFGGSGPVYYSPAREAVRQQINAWIRTSGAYDGIVDFDAAVRDPTNPIRLQPAYDGGDHLHLNDAGYTALANSIPLGLF